MSLRDTTNEARHYLAACDMPVTSSNIIAVAARAARDNVSVPAAVARCIREGRVR